MKPTNNRLVAVTITRVWAMPHKYTFKVAPLLDIILRYKKAGEYWIDPFAGANSPAERTNDINPEHPTHCHMEAIEFVNSIEHMVDGVIFDPPYSLT